MRIKKSKKYIGFSDESARIGTAVDYLLRNVPELAERLSTVPEEQRISAACSLWELKWDTEKLGEYPGDIAAVAMRLWLPTQIGLVRWLEILHLKLYNPRLRRKMRKLYMTDEEFTASLKGWGWVPLWMSLPDNSASRSEC